MVGIKFKPFLVVFVTIVMVLSTLGLFYATGNPSGGSSPASSGVTAALPSSTASNTVSGNTNTGLSAVVNNALKDKNLTKDLFIPNVNYLPGMQNNHVEPLYGQAPAPMGIGDFGLVNRGGHIVGTKMKTSSFEGTWTVNNLTAFNLGNDGPYSVTVQMNTILAHTTILGKSNFVYWTQNVIVYSTRTHSLTFEDNIWNFSSPTAVMNPSTIYNSTGNVIPYPGVHIAIGPTVTLNYPFTVNLFLNTTVLDGMDTVYFNYSIPSLMMNGTYDRVMFNSTYGMPPGYSARPAYFEVNGNKLNPVGLLYDAELMIGGPGGGSTNSIYAMNSVMSLKYLSTVPQMNLFNAPPTPPGPHGPGMSSQSLNGQLPGPGNGGPGNPPSPPGSGPMHFHAHKAIRRQYLNVPSAYDFGTDTGETSEGVSVSWNAQDQAMLSAGPSLLYGMWNVSSTNIMEHFTGKVSPSNAFMFVDTGNHVNPNTAGWAPLTASGSYNFWLPLGMYTAKFMLSYYDPVTVHLRAHFSFNYLNEFNQLNVKSEQSIHLKRNAEDGIYTPLFAMNNAQLANISVSGNGTRSNPYIAENSASPRISPLFGEVNDFLFPVFEGVMIRNTNAYFEMNGMPDFSFQMPQYTDLFLNFFKLPETNYMGYWLYNTSNISIWNSSLITGWFSPFGSGFPYANVMIWNSSSDLVGSDTFQTMDSSMLIFGGTNNTVWGNTFTNVSPVLLNSSAMNNVSLYGAPLALSVYSSGNLIYNNNFTTTIPAYSPDYSIYTGNTAYYIDSWNVSTQPATVVHSVNGYKLSGNIIGGKYQGGNYWYNFDGIIPFNDEGLISNGGDYEPLNGFINVTNPYNGIQNDSSVQVSPPPVVPDTTPINITLFSNFTVLHWCPTVSGTFQAPSGNFAAIVVTYSGEATGVVYDSSYWLTLNNATVFTGTTPEYGNWSVQNNITEFSSLLQGKVYFYFYPPMAIIDGSFVNSVTISFYPVSSDSPALSEPNMVLSTPLSYANDVSTANVTVPSDTVAAKLLLYVYGYGADEFWYANEPYYSPFESISVTSGSTPIANVLPFPYINTGGINLFQWRPVTGVYTLNDRPYEVNVTAALGIIEGSHNLTVSMNKIDPGSFWQVSADLLIYTNPSAGPAQLISYNFTQPESFTFASSSGLNFTTVGGSAYNYGSIIPTSTGYILAGTNTSESFFNTQDYSANSVWENITQISATNTIDFTMYVNNGQFTNQTVVKSTLFPLVMDLGFPSVVVSTTNGTYPITELLITDIPIMVQGWLQSTSTATQYSSGLFGTSQQITEDMAVVSNAFNIANVTLTDPFAGVLNSVSNVSSLTAKYYYSVAIVNSTLENSFTHIIEAIANNASPPNYAASIVYDQIWKLENVPLVNF
ncbi:MAG: peptide-N4-asparagine amidase [Thermoplasmataceae archaeon]